MTGAASRKTLVTFDMKRGDEAWQPGDSAVIECNVPISSGERLIALEDMIRGDRSDVEIRVTAWQRLELPDLEIL